MRHVKAYRKRFTTEFRTHGGFDQNQTDRSDLLNLSDLSDSADGSSSFFPRLKLSRESPRRGNRKLLLLPTPKPSARPPPPTHSTKKLLALINIFDTFVPITRFSFRVCHSNDQYQTGFNYENKVKRKLRNKTSSKPAVQNTKTKRHCRNISNLQFYNLTKSFSEPRLTSLIKGYSCKKLYSSGRVKCNNTHPSNPSASLNTFAAGIGFRVPA